MDLFQRSHFVKLFKVWFVTVIVDQPRYQVYP